MNARDHNAIDPAAINPIIAYADQPEETAENVRNVLTFLALSFLGGNEAKGKQAEHGLGLILETCAAALNYHLVNASSEAQT